MSLTSKKAVKIKKMIIDVFTSYCRGDQKLIDNAKINQDSVPDCVKEAVAGHALHEDTPQQLEPLSYPHNVVFSTTEMMKRGDYEYDLNTKGANMRIYEAKAMFELDQLRSQHNEKYRLVLRKEKIEDVLSERIHEKKLNAKKQRRHVINAVMAHRHKLVEVNVSRKRKNISHRGRSMIKDKRQTSIEKFTKKK